MQTIPFFANQREFAAHKAELLDRIESTLTSGHALQGGPVTEFETAVANYCGRKHAVAVNSCTDALYFALKSCGVGPGDEVLVTDFSFVASASCIARAGAKPVFVDIGPDYNMDLARAGQHVTARTRALIFVHLYGLMGQPAAVESFCQQHGLALIEDSAQALGGQRDGRRAGSLGTVSCVSFDPTKVLSAPGSGGIALTDDELLAARLRRLRYHGKDTAGQFVEIGYNSQMPTLTAAVLRYKLEWNERWLERRRAIAGYYSRALQAHGFVVPEEPAHAVHVYHKYVVQHARRDAVKARLTGAGVETMVHYANPLHRQPAFAAWPQTEAAFPHALRCSQAVLSLPIHPFLTDGEVEAVARIACAS